MLFIHEINDVNQLPNLCLPEGIHYAAKSIGDADVLARDLRTVLVNALLANRVPAGLIHGALSPCAVNAGYAPDERIILDTYGYNPIVLRPQADAKFLPFVWGSRFQAYDQGVLQSLRIAGNMGISTEFRDFVVKHLWSTSSAAPGGLQPSAAVPAMNAPQAVQEPSPSPIHRALTAKPRQVGLFNRFL